MDTCRCHPSLSGMRSGLVPLIGASTYSNLAGSSGVPKQRTEHWGRFYETVSAEIYGYVKPNLVIFKFVILCVIW
jgi:hypothetical protein